MSLREETLLWSRLRVVHPILLHGTLVDFNAEPHMEQCDDTQTGERDCPAYGRPGLSGDILCHAIRPQDDDRARPATACRLDFESGRSRVRLRNR